MTTELEVTALSEASLPITATGEFIADEDSPERLTDLLNEQQKSFFPGYVKLITAEELMNAVYATKPPIIEGLLGQGLTLLTGTAKVGKSFMALQLAYCVSRGEPFLGFPTRKAKVVYFALEDTYARLQKRYAKMFGVEKVDKNLSFATEAEALGVGFEKQVDNIMTSKKDVGMIIVDVLQKIRDQDQKSDYTTDYEFMGKLKKLADEYEISIVVVHHTRKTRDADVMNMVSGSMGITGAADCVMVLQKEKRTDVDAELRITGRDMPDNIINVTKNPRNLQWELIGIQCEQDPEPIHPVILAVDNFLTGERTEWIGTASELCTLLSTDMSPNALSRFLGVHVNDLMKHHAIRFQPGRTNKTRTIRLTRLAEKE